MKFNFSKVTRSKDGKVLAQNFAYLSLLKIAGYIFPLITLPYLARVIGTDGFGKIAFASAIVSWVMTIADWGFNYTATRDVAKNRDDIEKVSSIFSNVLWARCILMFASLAVLLILIAIIPKFRNDALIILLTFLLIPGHIASPDWFFQAMEKMKYITILNLLAKLFFTISIFVIIKSPEDYIYHPVLTAGGYILSGVIAFYIILRQWKIKLYKPSLKQSFETIKKSTDVFLNNLMPNLYSNFSTILLGFFGGNVANGLLDAGSKFVGACQQLLQVIYRTFFPFLSRRIDKHDQFSKISVGLSVAMSAILFGFAPLIIKVFFTPEFYDSIAVMRIVSISLIFLTLSSTYGTNYLIIVGREKQLRNITFISSIIGFALSFLLIYYFSYIGAALTITITRGILGLSVYRSAKIHKSNVKKQNEIKVD